MLEVGVTGRGAIGSLLAAKLRTSGINPVAFWRDRQAQPVTVRFQNQQKVTISASENKAVEVLIVPVKAWQVYKALTDLRNNIRADTCIVLLHNGAGTEDRVQQQFPDNPIVRMTTSIAARKIRDDEVVETGYGATQAGWLRKGDEQQVKQIETLFSSLLSPCEWFDDIRQPVWQKLAINAVINPLTAIHNVQNGKLAEPQFDAIKAELIGEFLLIAAAVGLKFDEDALSKIIEKVIQLTANNYSSMHQDIAHQRKTEVEYINGFLVETARQHQIDATGHEKMLKTIYSLESSYL